MYVGYKMKVLRGDYVNILSQDKRKIINYNNVASICMKKRDIYPNTNKYEIIATYPADKSYDVLATFENEIKCEKVFEGMLTKIRANENLISIEAIYKELGLCH